MRACRPAGSTMPMSGAGLLIHLRWSGSVHVVRRMSSAWLQWETTLPLFKHKLTDGATRGRLTKRRIRDASGVGQACTGGRLGFLVSLRPLSFDMGSSVGGQRGPLVRPPRRLLSFCFCRFYWLGRLCAFVRCVLSTDVLGMVHFCFFVVLLGRCKYRHGGCPFIKDRYCLSGQQQSLRLLPTSCLVLRWSS